MLVDPGVGETRLSHTRRCWNLLYRTNAIENKMTIIFLCQTIRIHPQQFSLSLVVEQGTTDFSLNISWKRMVGWYNNTNRNSNLHALRNCYVPIIAKFYCFASQFVPDIESNSMVSGLTTRHITYCWCPYSHKPLKEYLFHETITKMMTNVIRMHWKCWTLRSYFWYDHTKVISINISQNRYWKYR